MTAGGCSYQILPETIPARTSLAPLSVYKEFSFEVSIWGAKNETANGKEKMFHWTVLALGLGCVGTKAFPHMALASKRVRCAVCRGVHPKGRQPGQLHCPRRCWELSRTCLCVHDTVMSKESGSHPWDFGALGSKALHDFLSAKHALLASPRWIRATSVS